MQIQRNSLSRLTRRQPSVPAKQTTLGEEKSLREKIGDATVLAVPISGAVAAGAAAYSVSNILSFGDGMPALYGGLSGGIMGAGIGFGAAYVGSKLYDKFSGDDGFGKALMGGMVTLSGLAVGTAVGTISGAFGSNPFVTVPAALIGGAAGIAVSAAAHTALFPE